jgi:23S rRNA pseudouridine955/2504/2580 synthase
MRGDNALYRRYIPDMKTFTISDEDDDIRLDRWFKRYFPQVPHGFVEKSIRTGIVRLDGKKSESAARVKAGQIILIKNPEFGDNEEKNQEAARNSVKKKEEKRMNISVDDIKMLQDAILYKDERILVINKPAGLAVQGGTNMERNLDDMLGALQFDKKDKPRLVHRLDKDTSGALILARDVRTAAELSEHFRSKEIRKIYWALIMGEPDIAEGKIDLPLAKVESGKDSRMEHVDVDEDRGKKAITRYLVLESLAGRISWVELEPITGRTHQLRVHMAAIGHPIVGDGKYGGADAFIEGIDIAKQLHLHARRVEIPDWKGKTLVVEAPMPKHMKKSFAELGPEG